MLVQLCYSIQLHIQHNMTKVGCLGKLTDCKGVSVRQSISREEQCCISSVGSEQVGESLTLV